MRDVIDRPAHISPKRYRREELSPWGNPADFPFMAAYLSFVAAKNNWPMDDAERELIDSAPAITREHLQEMLALAAVGAEAAPDDAPVTLAQPRPPLTPSAFDPVRLVGMSRAARRRAWMAAGAEPAAREGFGLSGRLAGKLRPCRFCRGYEGCARCRAGHGPGLCCVFCEPCGVRPKINRTNTPICDGSGVLSSEDIDGK